MDDEIIFPYLFHIDFLSIKKKLHMQAQSYITDLACDLKIKKYISCTKFLRHRQLNVWRVDFHTWAKTFQF